MSTLAGTGGFSFFGMDLLYVYSVCAGLAAPFWSVKNILLIKKRKNVGFSVKIFIHNKKIWQTTWSKQIQHFI